MVTFVCQNCDLTLKKKQVDGHIRGCYPAAMICIDCSQTFYGNEHKGHVTCISEQDKHWGDYAPSRNQKNKFIAKQPKNVKAENESKQEEQKMQKVEKVDDTHKAERQFEQKTEEEKSQWRGWKNEIKSLIRESDNKIEKKELIKKLRKVFKRKQDEEMTKEQFEQVFNIKISKIDKVKESVFYSLQ